MQLVTFARAVAPHSRGDKRVVPDDVAQRLADEGDISSAEPWPSPAPAHASRAPKRAIIKFGRPVTAPDRREAR